MCGGLGFGAGGGSLPLDFTAAMMEESGMRNASAIFLSCS